LSEKPRAAGLLTQQNPLDNPLEVSAWWRDVHHHIFNSRFK
jgi:hypothetical protein